MSFLHRWADANYSVDRSLFAFLLPPTEATATVEETGPRLPYLHISIIKTHLWKYRRIFPVMLSTLQHRMTKSHTYGHFLGICPCYHGNISIFSVAVETRQTPRPPWRQPMRWPLRLHHSAALKRSDHQDLWPSDSIWIQWRTHAEQQQSFHRGKIILSDAATY